MGRVVRKTGAVTVVGIDHHNGRYYSNFLAGGMAPLAPPYIPAPIPLERRRSRNRTTPR